MDEVQVTRAGDVERIYRETGERLWWALLAYSGDREIASDAAAEAFARALQSTSTIRDPSAWVWRVAFRVATAEMRNRPRTASGREDAYELDERSLDVIRALNQLSPKQRAVTVLFYLDDRPTAEIADVLGMASTTVSVHLHRARTRLRSILGEDDA